MNRFIAKGAAATSLLLLVTVASAMPVAANEGKQSSHVIREGPLGLTIRPFSGGSSQLTGANASSRAASAEEWIAQNPRGTDAGWSISVAASTDLVSAAGTVETTPRSIAAGNVTIVPGTASAKSGSDAATNVSTHDVALTSSPQTLLACSSGCKGRYGFTPAFDVVVPASAYRSNYSGAVGGSTLNPYEITVTFTIS